MGKGVLQVIRFINDPDTYLTSELVPTSDKSRAKEFEDVESAEKFIADNVLEKQEYEIIPVESGGK